MGKNVISDDEDDVENEEPEGEPVDDEEDDAPARRYNDDEEDEDDEEGQDEYEQDDFIVDDVDEEEPGEEEEKVDSDEERHKKKKKKKKREAEDLDEDDYELLRDNNAFHRRPKDSKKFKRLKKAQRDSDDFVHSEDEFDGSGEVGRTAEEKLKRSLFGDDEGQYEDIPEEEEEVEEELDVGEDDDMADFIVDEDYVDENGAPVRRKNVKGKRFKKAEGVSSSAIMEAHEIFGDVDELLLKRKKGLEYTEWSEGKLEDQFEPTILSEKYMTENDDKIRDNDIPERMQLSEESTGHPATENISLLEESAWILKQLNSGVVPFCCQSQMEYAEKGVELSISKADLYEFLSLHNVQKMDIPFIAMYRKEECSSLLRDPVNQGLDDMNQDHSGGVSLLKWHKMLWAIQDLDKKWLLLQKRKAALNSHYRKRFDEEKRRIYDITRSNLNEQLFESICNALKNAESEREVDDVDMKFNLHFPPGEVDVDEGKYKRPRRRSHYSVCSKAGFWEVASKFGCSAEQLGNCLSLIRVGEELEDAKETPEEVASNFTCNMFETPQEVLKGARHMAAVEISCEPSVRKHVRSTYMDHATVSTVPTADGRVAIDAFHQFAGVKWLLNKPIREFNDVQWLLIQKAEEEKLLKVTFKLPEETMASLMNEIKNYYLSPGVSKSAQLWNEQRELILQDAFHGFLLPSMEKEARALLTSKAKTWVLWEYGKALWDKISVGPFQRRDNDITSDDEAAPKVMACCWGPGKPATTFVMLDSSGEVLDVLYTGSLTLRSQNVNDQQRKKNDQQRLLKFMMDHQPHVVVLGAANLSCTRLKTDIYEIIFKMVEENPRDVGSEMSDINIVYGDESLPRLYENSRISSDQLPAQSGIVKRAVALGRYLQNPLAMVASLCGPGKEILSWKLTPLENFLTADDKYSIIEQVMVDVTNQVGLDINLATGHEWLFSPLQFISGLGPRKAAYLQRSLVRRGVVYTRKDFLTAHGLGKRVFLNAAGFLRVRRGGLATKYPDFMDLLDDTRINPESYGLAQEMAKVVYETETGDANDDEALEAIDHVRNRPNLLKKLDLDDDSPGSYVKVKNRENKKLTLKDIRKELIQGFQDWRKPYKEPNQDEEFSLISGETDETLAEGRIVQATVRKVQGPRAICALESGLTGILMKEDYADDWRDIPELSDRLREEDILTCKIKSIQKNRYQVFLVCKESEMRNTRHQHPAKLDKYYHEDQSSLHSEQEKARKEKELAKKHFKPRMIVHPRFQNITADEAMQFLSDKEPGESIIRPSSRGPSFLTLTLKVHDGVYAHKDIVEGGKEHKDITSLLRLGKTLKIGEDTFEDLDEVMDRYVDPLVGHLKAMLSYRKFRKGNKAEVDDLLRLEKSESPMRIVYAFGISHEHPGTFILTYIRSSNPHHEYIGVYPKGFKFRKRMFEDIDRLVAYFQRHIDDPVHDSAPSIRSVAAMVPMRSPATGGSSGGGWGGGTTDEGGWRGQSFDRDRSSQQRTGRNDNRNTGNRDGQTSGLPRPHGGRGRGRGSYNGARGNGTTNDRQDSGYDNPRWGKTSKDGDADSGSLSGAKGNNSPGKEAFAGGWGAGGGESGAGTGEWGHDGAAGGWGGESKGSGWGGSDGRGQSSGGGSGNDETNGWGSQKSSGGAKTDGGGWGSQKSSGGAKTNGGWSTGAGTGGGW